MGHYQNQERGPWHTTSRVRLTHSHAYDKYSDPPKAYQHMSFQVCTFVFFQMNWVTFCCRFGPRCIAIESTMATYALGDRLCFLSITVITVHPKAYQHMSFQVCTFFFFFKWTESASVPGLDPNALQWSQLWHPMLWETNSVFWAQWWWWSLHVWDIQNTVSLWSYLYRSICSNGCTWLEQSESPPVSDPLSAWLCHVRMRAQTRLSPCSCASGGGQGNNHPTTP